MFYKPLVAIVITTNMPYHSIYRYYIQYVPSYTLYVYIGAIKDIVEPKIYYSDPVSLYCENSCSDGRHEWYKNGKSCANFTQAVMNTTERGIYQCFTQCDSEPISIRTYRVLPNG